MPNPDNIKGKGFDKNPQNINRNGQPRKLPDLDVAVANILGAEVGNKTKLDKLLEQLFRMAMKGNTRAAEILMDRGFGKPKQDMEQKTIIYSVDVDDEEAKRLAKAILAEIR